METVWLGVALRLKSEDYHRLVRLGLVDGLKPATMARVLILRALAENDAKKVME